MDMDFLDDVSVLLNLDSMEEQESFPTEEDDDLMFGFGESQNLSSPERNQAQAITCVSSSSSNAPLPMINHKNGICSVCGDHSIGIHYGASVCSGCRSFFRRTILGGKNYKCITGRRSSPCEISADRRNHCKGCRIKRCLQVGMKPEDLTKRVRQDDTNLEEPSMVDNSLILRSTQSVNIINLFGTYYASQHYAESMIDIPAVDEKTAENDQLAFRGACHNAMQAQALWLGSWVKRIPGFMELETGDQVLLFTSAAQKYFVLRTAHDTARCPEAYNKMQFNCMNKVRTPLNSPHLIAYANERGFPEYHSAHMTLREVVVASMMEANITDNAFICFLAYVVLDPNVQGLYKPGAVRKLRTALQSQVLAENGLNPSLPSGVMELLSLLPTVNELALITVRGVAKFGCFSDLGKCAKVVKEVYTYSP